MTVGWEKLLPHLVHDIRSFVRKSLTGAQLVERQAGATLDPEVAKLLRSSIDAQKQLNQFAVRVGLLAEADSTPSREVTDLDIVLLGAKIHCKDDLETANADFAVIAAPEAKVPVQLQVVLQELIDNAIRYRHPERRLQIRIEAVETVFQGKSLLNISVVDNGSGWDPAFQSKLMAPLERLDTVRGGFGLGLAIANALTASWGGTLQAETRSEGSRFTATIPLSDVEPR